jgi:hypothetical protein
MIKQLLLVVPVVEVHQMTVLAVAQLVKTVQQPLMMFPVVEMLQMVLLVTIQSMKPVQQLKKNQISNEKKKKIFLIDITT